MKKILATLLTITVLEIWALSVFRGHPLVRPEWFPSLLLVIQLLMGLGGVYASRWLLRYSPVSKLEGPSSDWTKLWLWCGPVGGFLLIKACLLGKIVAAYFSSSIIGWAVAAHIAGGAVIWAVSLPWAVSDLLRDHRAGFRERLLMQAGIASHILGFAVYIGYFPGPDLNPISLLAAVYFFGAVLYYIMAVAVQWAILFKFWRPSGPISEEAPSLEKESTSPSDSSND